MKNSKVTFFVFSLMLLNIVLPQLLISCQATNTSSVAAIREGRMSKVIHQSDNTVVNAITEATIGGTAGSLIAWDMDKQSEELQSDLKGAIVKRVGEGILLTFDSDLLFEHDSFELHTKNKLKELAKSLNKYGYTNILIEGHTDSTGEELYNLSLSEKRVHEIENYLVNHDVKNARIRAKGIGEKQPLAGNDTEAGRNTNRRVEFAIYANDEMKNLAMEGKLKEYTASKK